MRKKLFFLTVLAALLLTLLPAPNAGAHTGDQSYLYLDITESVSVDFQIPFADIAEHLGIEIDGSDDEIEAAIAANASVFAEFASEHFSVGDSSGTWALSEPTVSRFRETDYVSVAYSAQVDPASIDDVLEVSLDPFFDENGDRDALFLIANDWERGYVDANETDPLARFTEGSRVQQIDIGDRSWTKNFSTSVALGVDHIKTGPDHILFVAVLLLPSVLAFTGRWEPTPKFGRSFWRVLKIVSMFTVAHSITFTLAGMSIIPLPGPRFVETIIALSIAAAAYHNLRPVYPEKEWLIAFAFGLFHGLGFASLIEDLDISRSTQLVSLLGRNLGIEFGQAFVVVLVFPVLFVLRRTRLYMPLFTWGSIALIVISLGWMTERLFDAPGWTSRVVDTAIEWPRIFWIVIALGIASAAFYQQQAKQDRLLPVAGESAAPSGEREKELVG